MKRKAKIVVSDKSTVRLYRHFEELRDCLASGWSAPMVREYLIERYGLEKVPHEKAIQRWRDKHLGEAQIIPHQIIQKKLKGVHFKVDVIGHLSRLVALLEERVARGIEKEDELMGMPISSNDGVVQVYLQALMNYVKVAQDLGIMKAPPLPPLIDARTLNVTPETARAFLETVKEIKKLEVKR